MQRFILVIIAIFTASLVSAQTAVLSGTVTDKDDLPIIGATVIVDGAAIGAATDLEGKYRVDGIPVGDVKVKFSFIGLKPQFHPFTFKEGGVLTFDVQLLEDRLLLDQVVVVGYGTTQKRDVAGSISSISVKEIEKSPQTSIDQTLQGQAAGVSVTSQNGIAGSAVKINIRGTNSIAAGSQPLVVVDGIPITTGSFDPGNLGSGSNALSDINPNDIESIDILKDAAATAIYGSRGANGVVLITTKKGKDGKASINVGYKYGIVNETNRMDFLSAQEHLALRDQARTDAGQDPEDQSAGVGGGLNRAEADSIAANGGTDWVDRVLRTGEVHEVTLSIAGGSEKTKYYIGGTYYHQDGFLAGNTFDRLSARVNLDNKVGKILRIGSNIGLTYTKNDRVRTGEAGGLGAAQLLLPYIPVEDEQGEFYQEVFNPVWALDNQSFVANNIRTIGSVYGDLNLHKNLVFHTDIGVDFLNIQEDEFNYRNVNDPASTSSAWDRTTRVVNWTNSNYLTYDNTWKENHYFKGMVGQSAQRMTTSGFGLFGYDFPNDHLTGPADAPQENQSGYSYEQEQSLLSYFARFNYKLNQKYLFNVSLRGDGSSKFGPDNKWGFFPAGSVGWVISDENFMKGSKAVPYLKLSTSYGFSGNDQIPNYAFQSLYSTGFDYADTSGIQPTQLANPQLRWEKSEQLDVNLDYAFANSRIFGSITYYQKQSSDLLLFLSLPTSSGYSGVWQNVGVVKNWGIEFSLTTKNINKKFKWQTSLNVAMNRNTVLDAASLPPDAFESGQPGEGRVIEGHPVGQSFLVEFAGVQAQDGQIGKFDIDGNAVVDGSGNLQMIDVAGGTELFYDINGNEMTFEDPTGGDFYGLHRKPMGSPLPDFYGGITNTLSFAGVELSFLISGAYGNTIYDDAAKTQIGSWQNNAQRREILDAWSLDNPDTDVPGLNNYTAVNSSRFLYDASYIRLRSITLGYDLPAKVLAKMKLSKMRIYVQGGNLWTFSAFPGWDPEVLRNVDPNSQAGNVSFAGPYLGTPQARTINIGFQIGI
ncbi:MAG: TonB-linked SusC/RagA family outer membrane protein [Flavobacteriales bacterium]|jgi:TonB-linked SusC/RagA family outer membrane protein